MLLSHILLASAVPPLAILAILRGQTDRRRRIVRFLFPIRVYVSITGVLVYWMLRPYYPH